MHCTLQGWSRADSSVPVRRDCVWAHTLSYTQTECRRYTQTTRQVRQPFCVRWTASGFTRWSVHLSVTASWEEERGELLYTDDRVSLIFDMLWFRQLPCLLLVMAAVFFLTWKYLSLGFIIERRFKIADMHVGYVLVFVCFTFLKHTDTVLTVADLNIMELFCVIFCECWCAQFNF